MKMKLDKIRFAMLINWLSRNGLHELAAGDIEDLDNIVDIQVEQTFMDVNGLHQLMALMQEGTKKIEAIQVHRSLTGCGLKESKDAVEKYWPNQQPTLNPEDALYKALKNGEADAEMQQDADSEPMEDYNWEEWLDLNN